MTGRERRSQSTLRAAARKGDARPVALAVSAVLAFTLGLFGGAPSARARDEPARRSAAFEWYFRGTTAGAHEGLVAEGDRIAKDVSAPLGGRFPATRVVLAGNDDDFHAALPAGVRLPRSVLGVAFYEHRLIVLRNAPDLARTLRHEASHIALLHATAPYRPPRWLLEGFAAQQSDESPLLRLASVQRAAAARALIPMADLEAHIPLGTHGSELAYAQSNEMVAFLLGRFGEAKLRGLVGFIAAGVPFAEATRRAYGETPQALDAAFRADLEERFDWLPIVTGAGVLWALVTFVFLLAYARKRGRARARMAELARQDEEEEPRPPPEVELEIALRRAMRARESSAPEKKTGEPH